MISEINTSNCILTRVYDYQDNEKHKAVNEKIHAFITSKGISFAETSDLNPYDLLLNIDDAEEFLRIASEEQVAIIGAGVYEKRGKDNYVISKRTLGLDWSCQYSDNEKCTDPSYISRSIKMAEENLWKIRAIIKEREQRWFARKRPLLINFVF